MIQMINKDSPQHFSAHKRDKHAAVVDSIQRGH